MSNKIVGSFEKTALEMVKFWPTAKLELSGDVKIGLRAGLGMKPEIFKSF